jgi:uncharacterized protein (DUF2249 family)
MTHSPLTLDVRPALVEGQDLFGTIRQAIGQLGADQELLLITPFEPTSLYTLLEQQGFMHQTEHAAANEGRVMVRWATAAAPGPAVHQPTNITARPAGPPERSASTTPQIIQLDTRGMDPPGSLVRILTTLETLGDGQSLVAHIDREPLLLFPELLNRGWAYEGAPQADSSFIIRIFRPVTNGS